MKKDWKYFFSPCKICAILSLVFVIAGLVSINRSDGWSIFLVISMVPAVLLLLAIDWAIKRIIGHKLLYVWLAEVIIIVALICIFNDTIEMALGYLAWVVLS